MVKKKDFENQIQVENYKEYNGMVNIRLKPNQKIGENSSRDNSARSISSQEGSSAAKKKENKIKDKNNRTNNYILDTDFV